MIRLREGDLFLDVSPQPEGKPMRVITPSAEAVVLGTQFNVSASPLSTSLTVNEGNVQVTRLADGSVQEVKADHRVIAALEHESPFQASPRGDSVRIWKSEFPRDVRQGSLGFGAEGRPNELHAEAHLFRGDYGETIDPVLLTLRWLGLVVVKCSQSSFPRGHDSESGDTLINLIRSISDLEPIMPGVVFRGNFRSSASSSRIRMDGLTSNWRWKIS